MKDDSGAHAVFTEQDSTASQMTAAKVMDVIARQPGSDGRAADAISAYIQQFQSQNVQIYGYVFTNGRNHGQVWKDPVVPLERHLYGHPSGGLLWER